MANSKPVQTKHWLTLLASLFVIVLIAHLAIITSAKDQFGNAKPASAEVFTTRMVELPAPKPVTDTPPKVVTPPKSAKPKAEVAAVPKDVSNPILPPAAPTAPAALAPEQAQPAIEAAPPVPEPTPAIASGDSGLPPPAFAALSSGRHIYKVAFTKNSVLNQGDSEITWQQDGEKYTLNMLATYTLLIKAFRVFEQNSTGLVTAQGLQPLRFSDKRLNRSEVAAHFDYASQKIIFSANKPEVLLQAGAQDRISVILQLAGLLAAQPARYPPGSTLTMQTVSASDAEPWLFTVNEPETLNLSTGPQIALRLTRNPRREYDQKIELWFATDLSYLPVRFRFTETNNDYVDAVWQSTQVLPNTLP
jgi:hypothetical protein